MREVDGKAWIVSARVSTGTRALIARTHSWIAAEASGHGHGGPGQLARAPVDDDRDVAEFGLHGVALGRLREVGDELERVEARVARLVERHADRGRLGVRVGRARQRAVVGFDRFAERHPDRELALVVTLVGVQLRAGRVAGHPQPVRHAQPAVVRDAVPLRGVEPVVLEAEVLQPEVAPDRQQDHVPFDRRSVVELDDVGAIGTLTGACPLRPRARPQDHAVAEQRRGDASALRMCRSGGSAGPTGQTVVGTPNRANTCASSTPVGPPPRTSSSAAAPGRASPGGSSTASSRQDRRSAGPWTRTLSRR